MADAYMLSVLQPGVSTAMEQEGIRKFIDFLFYMPFVTIMSKQPGSWQFRVE
jgi:hypothetical protein